MQIIDENNRTYRIKDIEHTISEDIIFVDKKPFNYDKSFTDNLYDHILFTKKILDKYIPDKYCAISGTLLGCIRHQGIIPWDSDADFLCMKKEMKVLEDNIKNINEVDKNYTFVYIKVSGSIKIYFKGHCFVDIFGYDFMKNDDKIILSYGPVINGENKYYHADVFPNERYNYHDIFPIKKLKFEDFELNCPKNHEKILFANYSTKVLSEVKYPNSLHQSTHDDFFNTINANVLYNKIYNIMKEYTHLNAFIGIQPQIVFFFSVKNYLSQENKQLFIKAFKNYKLSDFISVYVFYDLIRFFLNLEPIKVGLCFYKKYKV